MDRGGPVGGCAVSSRHPSLFRDAPQSRILAASIAATPRIHSEMASAQLEETLKAQIIETLNLEDISPDDIDSTAALFGEGLGLDSIDALELIVLMDKEHGVKLVDPKKGKDVFYSVRTMADYIEARRS